jgi:hypothetical protein
MSDDADEDSLAARLRAGYRTVSPGYEGRPNAEMDAVGWVVLAGVVLLFLPFLPLLVAAWLLSKAVEFLADLPGD